MTQPDTVQKALDDSPQREDAFFNRFEIVWHIIAFANMALCLCLALRHAQDQGTLGLKHILLFALTLAQAGIYVYTFIRHDCWPPTTLRLILNFVVAPALVIIEQAIAPVYSLMFWLYLGLAFSFALPLWAGVACIWAMTFLFYASVITPRSAIEDPGSLLPAILQAVFTSLVYFYWHASTRFGAERKTMVERLQQANQELQAAHAKESELAVLRERERIARDMHDSLGHTLVALNVQLEATQRLYKKDPERASAQMDAMKALTRDSMAALRRTLAGLRTPGLGEQPLRLALQELCLSVSSRSGTRVHCDIDPKADGLNGALADLVWCVVQEALTNVEKHAHAKQAEVTVCLGQDLALWIIDDGTGIAPDDQSRDGHYGLRGMHERVEGLGGTIRICPNPMGGTRIEVHAPLIHHG